MKGELKMKRIFIIMALAAAMALSSVSVIVNALRLKSVRLGK